MNLIMGLLILIAILPGNYLKAEDACYAVLLQNKKAQDSNITFVVSSYEKEYSGKYAIDSLHTDKAWCPKSKVSSDMKEYITIDLGKINIVKMIMTKGISRHGYGSASFYYINYKREQSDSWKRYGNSSHFQKIAGNKDHLTEKFSLLNPSIVARWIRIYPIIVNQPEMICLNLQLFGCEDENHVLEYQVIDGSQYFSVSEPYQSQFTDRIYDGIVNKNNRFLKYGLGKLTDHDFQQDDNFLRHDKYSKDSPYMGWNRKYPASINFVNIDFRFSSIRKFNKVKFRLSNAQKFDVSLPSTIEVRLRINATQTATDPIIRKDIEQDSENQGSKWIVVMLNGGVGKYASVDLYFSGLWILLREVEFISEPYNPVPTKKKFIKVISLYNHRSSTLNPRSPKDSSQNPYNRTHPYYKNPNSSNNNKPNYNVLTISDIVLSSSISLVVLFMLGICFLGYLRWRRCNKIKKYKKALHLQSQDDEYHRILTMQHSSHLKSSKLYQQVMSSPTYTDKFKLKEDSNIIYPARNVYMPDAYWMYSELNQERNSNHEICSIDSSKYMTVDGKNGIEQGDINIQGVLGNSRMSKMQQFKLNSTNFLLDSPKSSLPDVDIINYLNVNHITILDTLIPTKYGVIYIVENMGMTMADQTINRPEMSTPRCFTIRQSNRDVPHHIRKLVQSEIEILSSINHPHIIKYSHLHNPSQTSSSSSPSSLCIISEYTNLTDLYTLFATLPISSNNTSSSTMSSPSLLLPSSAEYNNLLICNNLDTQQNGCLNIETSHLLYIATQISMAMSYLETNSIIHRDLACRNILVTDVNLTIKISDIAIATNRFRNHYCSSQILVSTNPPTTPTNNTIHNNNVGTSCLATNSLVPIRWLSWETLVKNEFSSKSDIYSFGITIWEILQFCRQLPYAAMSDFQIFYNKYTLSTNSQSQQALKYPIETPRELSDFIEQCLQDNALQRPSFRDAHLFFTNKTNGYKPRDVLGPYMTYLRSNSYTKIA